MHGHVRSGTHYLRVLLKVNFDVRGQEGLGHHDLPGKWVHDGKIKFCVKRDFLGVANSMWSMGKRFGIGASTLEDFMDTPWVKQWKKFPPSELELGPPNRRRTKLVPTSGMFRTCALTPREYHSMYVHKWEQFPSNNVFTVNYDLLLSDFEEEMLKIAEHVGSDKISFTNLTKTGPSRPK